MELNGTENVKAKAIYFINLLMSLYVLEQYDYIQNNKDISQ
jgi:hypothetical protein